MSFKPIIILIGLIGLAYSASSSKTFNQPQDNPSSICYSECLSPTSDKEHGSSCECNCHQTSNAPPELSNSFVVPTQRNPQAFLIVPTPLSGYFQISYNEEILFKPLPRLFCVAQSTQILRI